MQLPDIQANLDSDDPKLRIRGIVALKAYQPEVAVPLLLRRCHDQEAMIRSMTAIVLGYQRNDEAFQALVAMLESESTAAVRAEVVSALLKYGKRAIPVVVPAFYNTPHWLMRMSILLALTETNTPNILFDLCLDALVDPEMTVRETALQCLAYLVGSDYEEDALLHLIAFSLSNDWQIRRQTAIALHRFSGHGAEEALHRLRYDRDYRVIAVFLNEALKKT